MAKFKVVPFEPEHLEMLALKPEQSDERPEGINGSAISFLLDEKPVAIVGGFPIVPNVFQVWALISEDVKKHPFAFHRSVRAMLAWVTAERGLQRIQLSVKIGFMGGCRWAEALGFKNEGVMRSYGPGGSDYYLYGRTA